jgi:anion-transporting  ArsA/GET3 family ATPase
MKTSQYGSPMWTSTKQILFVTGKGGVGKSAVAAAIGHRAAKQGRRVLLAELGDHSYYEKFFQLPALTYRPQQVFPGMDVALWTGETCLREYVLHFLKVEKIYQMFFENRIMKAFVNVAPGVSELAILGKVTSGIRKMGPRMDYDLIVIDAYSTGHFLALIQAPRGLSEAIRSGPFGEQSASIVKVLQDAEKVGYVVVTLPEPLPVAESQELVQTMKSTYGHEARVVCNRVLNAQFESSEWSAIEHDPQLQSPGVQKYFKYLQFILGRQKKCLQELKESNGYAQDLPLVVEASDNRNLIERLSERIEL